MLFNKLCKNVKPNYMTIQVDPFTIDKIKKFMNRITSKPYQFNKKLITITFDISDKIRLNKIFKNYYIQKKYLSNIK